MGERTPTGDAWPIHDLADIIRTAPLIVFAIDLDGIVRMASGGGLTELGPRPDLMVGSNVLAEYAHRADVVEHLRRALRGESFVVQNEIGDRIYETRYSPAHRSDGSTVGTLGVAIDVTDRVRDQRSMRRLVAHDPVTGLYSRQFTEAELGHAVSAGWTIGLLLIDLDDFKDLNDSHGHSLGDRALRRLSDRVKVAAPTAALVGRMGGDEMVVAVRTNDRDTLAHIANRILDAVAQPLRIDIPDGTVDVSITASIGIATAPASGSSTTALLARADTAMYAAKRSGGAAYRFYDPATDDAHRRLTVATRLRRAVADGAIAPVYQPIRLLHDGTVIGFEALARWHDPELGTVSPVEFIAMAEKSPLIDALFDSVLCQALRAAADWQAGGRPAGIGVNIAAGQLRDPLLATRIASTAADLGFPVESLRIELTESAMLDDEKTQRTMRALGDAGIRLYIDDFGVGHSNVWRLADLSAAGILDGIKIDRRFVATPADERTRTLLRLFRHMAETFGVDVIVEGIENESQLQLARELGYPKGQGWYLGRPMDAAAAAALLTGPPGLP